MSNDFHSMAEWYADFYMWLPVAVLSLMFAAGVALAVSALAARRKPAGRSRK